MSFRRASLLLSAAFLILPACSSHAAVMPATPGAPFVHSQRAAQHDSGEDFARTHRQAVDVKSEL